MTDWTPGVKADATKVVDLLIDRYTNPTKAAIRRWVIAGLKAAEPSLVLDLWGGGRSAAEMAAAGLPVLSVDDGRSFTEFGIRKPRGKRAMTVKGEADGYRTGWGSVVKYLPECDAAWLDFMGHPCHETERALAACKGKKIVFVTLMTSRLAGHEGLSVSSYIAMYKGLIEKISALRVTMIQKYRRPDGQHVLVFRAVYRATHHEQKSAYDAARRATHHEEIRAVEKGYCATHREEKSVYDAAYYATHSEEIRARRKARYATKKAERTEGATA